MECSGYAPRWDRGVPGTREFIAFYVSDDKVVGALNTLVLYAVAAAVIGGTSLFGGRGRARDAVVGGIVVATINNGMGLQGYSTAARLVVTAVVLVVAVTIDAVARKGRTTRV
jgi:ABC-type xylose transport system permease subunit